MAPAGLLGSVYRPPDSAGARRNTRGWKDGEDGGRTSRPPRPTPMSGRPPRRHNRHPRTARQNRPGGTITATRPGRPPPGHLAFPARPPAGYALPRMTADPDSSPAPPARP